MIHQSTGQASHTAKSRKGRLTYTQNGPRATFSNSPSPEPKPEVNLIDLSSDEELSQAFQAKTTISGESNQLGQEIKRNRNVQANNILQPWRPGRRLDNPRPENNREEHQSYSSSSSRHESNTRNLRRSPNGLPACVGLTVKKELCDRDGINTFLTPEGNEYYCYQHDPRNSDMTCHAIKKNKQQCERKCSDPEIRAGGRPVCNQHFGMNAKLIRM